MSTKVYDELMARCSERVQVEREPSHPGNGAGEAVLQGEEARAPGEARPAEWREEDLTTLLAAVDRLRQQLELLNVVIAGLQAARGEARGAPTVATA